MSRARQDAAAYRAAGLRVLRIHPTEKRPMVGGFGAQHPEFTCEPEDFRDGERVAILCGELPDWEEDYMLLVLDLDGGMTLQEVEDELGVALPTDTPSSKRGAHWYYSVPPSPERDELRQWTDALQTKARTGGKALDLKWAGGYAIEPELVDRLEEGIPMLGVEVLRALIARNQRAGGPSAAGGGKVAPGPGRADWSSPIAVQEELGRARVEACRGAKSGEAGQSALMRAIACARGWGLGLEWLPDGTAWGPAVEAVRAWDAKRSPENDRWFDDDRVWRKFGESDVVHGQFAAETPHVLKIGSTSEVAGCIVEGPLAGAVYDMGSIWMCRSDLVWTAVEPHEIQRMVEAYDGAPYGPSAMFRVSAQTVDSVRKLIQGRLTHQKFFESAPNGAAFACGTFFSAARGPEQLTREHRARFKLEVKFDPETPPRQTAAAMMQWFEGVEGEDAKARATCLFERLGLGLLGAYTDSGFQRAVILHGKGANGKSVWLELMGALFPSGTCTHVQPQDFAEQYSRATLAGSRMNIVSEIPETKLFASGHLKAILAYEEITARQIYREEFTFRPTCGHVFSANALPPTDDRSRGFQRRWDIIDFPNTFEGDRCDTQLAKRLIATELGAIASTAVVVAKRALDAQRPTVPASSKELLAAWMFDSDQVAEFEDECLERLDPETPRSEWTLVSSIGNVYRDWATSAGHYKLSRKKLKQRLVDLGVDCIRSERGIVMDVRIKRPQVVGNGDS